MSVVGPSRHFAAATIRRLSGAQRTLANRPPSASSAEVQEAPDIHGYAEQHLERLAARILEHQHSPTGFAHELQWQHRPRAIEFALQFVFVTEVIEGRTRRVVGGRSNEQHGAPLTVVVQSPAAVKDALAVLPEDLRAAIRVRSVQ